MLNLQDFHARVNLCISRALASLGRWGTPVMDELFASAITMSSSGKRTRATLVYAGLLSACPTPSEELVSQAVRAATSVELCQLATLIHDDIADSSSTRRGFPTTHASLTDCHSRNQWDGDSAHFGLASGIMAADAIFALSTREMLATGCFAAVELLSDMNEEVAVGQYLDMRAECHPHSTLSDAWSVITHKTVSYSALFPLRIGASLSTTTAGAAFLPHAPSLSSRDAHYGISEELDTHLLAFATPFGEAFQLRDDILGIVGNPEETGKPAAHDVSEGKKTVLYALLVDKISPQELSWLLSLQGTCLDGEHIARIRELYRNTGVLAEVEAMIHVRENAARTALTSMNAPARVLLTELVDALSSRTS
ncbi:polyprenyl synthetase family protein [Actinotignum urinale]|uniref:Polyprenyl synthetase family protein n=1 Tax=Actinotignum urinale TaxID=190146 RepID=A0AAW9HZY4_9ACTO|nr:polyprenyl synthetase family protein [Actinotignum urinale]MDY5129524.1 polyprenyl synthetase family protein [Actinotignum urinale]MDY5132185.1 polyprenyl synthetase family protein [Actinotignum urinale]MDY5151953.1 polyprenyl synthetase family protein [Actinotignum urinale]MDY5155411.1 polyprenyl synthetase family protein [Actinotignum urinale]MDY5160887.1 polyprenyl synthetase family protein [Actinotignum urinale]